MGTESGSLTSSEGPGADEENAAYKTDAFRMQCMKVLPCSKRYVHDWTECPFAHPQEKARRRDPRVYNYTGIACPNMKKDGTCPLREHCPYAHNVFEYWLHPTRYRTQLCNDGPNCHRKICFFAHSLEELRVPVAKPFVSPESLAAASAAVAAEDGARRQSSGGNLHQTSSPRSGIMEGSDSGLSYSSLEASGSNGFSGKATTTAPKVPIPGPEASQQLAVLEMVAGLLRQGRLTAAQANTILQQSLAPSPPTPRESSSSDQQATSSATLSQFLGTPARNPGRVLSRQLSNRSSSSVGSVGAPLGSSPPTAPVLELNSTRLSDPMAALFPASAQPSTAQALSEQLARLQLVQSLSSLHEHQQQLAAVQAAAGWDSTRSVPPLRSSSGLDSSSGMEDYSNLALAALHQQAAAQGCVSSAQAPPAVRSSGHDLVNTARLSLNANRYDEHEATLFKGLPADLRAGRSPELANAYASAFFSTHPDPTQRPSELESGQTEAISPTSDASPSPAALWAALSSIRSLETGEISQLRRSS